MSFLFLPSVFFNLVAGMPVMDLLFYRTTSWEKKQQQQQMLTCRGSGIEGFHSRCFWTALWVGCAVGSPPRGWWVAAVPGAGSPPQGTRGCLRGSGGHVDGRGSAGSDPACQGNYKEREMRHGGSTPQQFSCSWLGMTALAWPER